MRTQTSCKRPRTVVPEMEPFKAEKGARHEPGTVLVSAGSIGSGLRIRRNRKLPFELNSWAMAGDGSTPAAYLARANGGTGRGAVIAGGDLDCLELGRLRPSVCTPESCISPL